MFVPYSDQTYWPKDADRDHYRAEARKAYPHATEAQIERMARAYATQDHKLSYLPTHPGLVKMSERAATFDGQPVDDPAAAEVRLLGKPARKRLGLRWAA